jgi:hypothetical protein
MKKYVPFVLILFLLTVAFANAADKKAPLIGDSEAVFTLNPENQDVRGMAFDNISPQMPRLFVLDGSGKIFVYKPVQDSKQGIDELMFLETIDLPKASDGKAIGSPRGLAYAVERTQDILYFLNWEKSKSDVISHLWRFKPEEKTAEAVNLSFFNYRIGDRELFDVAWENGNIFVCFDSSKYNNQSLRVHRGIVKLKWNQAYDGKLEFIKHMPDSGHMPSRALTTMNMDGARYLWATVGFDHIYCAHLPTGRGLFYFDRPESSEKKNPFWGIAYGNDALWVAEGNEGPDRVHRVNVTKNLDAFYEGPRIVRHLAMSIETEPEDDFADPGIVYHYYSRPYAYNQLHNQGVWPETEKMTELSGVPNGKIKTFTYDPAEDVSSRQHMGLVEYASAPARTYSSKYEVDIWTNEYRKYVYPHRVNTNTEALKGLEYLADDPELFNLKDTDTYDAFFDRIKKHIEEKYSAPADMDNPYWAARNTLEYIQDRYYYPDRPKRKPAATDYDREHYDANPGNLKIDLSRNDYDKNQIIACSGTSVMIAGAMRYLGFPARWLGTGTEQGPGTWDSNGNGLLDENETATCSDGHRYTQVWLGTNYGWICFDGTPTRPDFNDFDPVPPIQTQWRYMNRAAKGHLKDKRIVFNVGSALFRPLYRDFEYDEKLAVNNDCGGDQRYNLQGRFDKPELWKLASSRITVQNMCFIESVALDGPKGETQVTWTLKGHWEKDPGALVSVYLQNVDPEKKKTKDLAILAKNLSPKAGAVTVDLSSYSGKNLRIIIRKVGDPETGGHSEVFDLE